MDECTLNELENSLECSICLERLDTSSKVLPCQHTFCKKCLEDIVSTHRELRCPECRVLVDAKVDDLPPNVLLMRILEVMRKAALKNQAEESVPPSSKRLKSSSGTAVHQRLFGEHQVAQAPIVTGNLVSTSGPESADAKQTKPEETKKLSQQRHIRLFKHIRWCMPASAETPNAVVQVVRR